MRPRSSRPFLFLLAIGSTKSRRATSRAVPRTGKKRPCRLTLKSVSNPLGIWFLTTFAPNYSRILWQSRLRKSGPSKDFLLFLIVSKQRKPLLAHLNWEPKSRAASWRVDVSTNRPKITKHMPGVKGEIISARCEDCSMDIAIPNTTTHSLEAAKKLADDAIRLHCDKYHKKTQRKAG